MSQWETISAPENPFKTRIRIDAVDRIELEYDQTNMDEVLAVNRALQNADRPSTSVWNGKDRVHVARVPEEFIHACFREGINFYRWNEDDRARFMQKLNDPDYAHLRVDDPSLRL